MEQDQCWMWTKRKYSPTNNNPSSYDESWEEQAFAKDAAGLDCIWPPRSYSCSFCSREFRSAQALGGHMNVHRRDRARLKQPYSPQNEVLGHDLESHVPHNPVQNSFASLDYLSSFSGLAYSSTNPNSDPSHVFPSTSKVLPKSINRNCKEKTMIPLYDSSSIFQGCHETSLDLSSKSLSNLAEDCGLYSCKFDHEGGADQKISKGFDFGCMSEECNNKTEVAVSLNLFVCRAHPPMQFETKETGKCIKKRKTDASSIPFFLKSNSVEKHDHKQSQMFEFSHDSIEELDLELRLGDKPKLAELQSKVRSDVSSEYWLNVKCAYPDRQLFDWGMMRLCRPLYGVGDPFAMDADDQLIKEEKGC